LRPPPKSKFGGGLFYTKKQSRTDLVPQILVDPTAIEDSVQELLWKMRKPKHDRSKL